MPSQRYLTALLLLAACEHSESTARKPAFPERPAPPPVVETKAPEPAPELAPVPVVEAPAVAPVQPTIILPKQPAPTDYDRRCMGRAGCHWEKQQQPEQPRVRKADQ